MKFLITIAALRTLRWTERLLFAAAVAMLAYCGFVLMDARNFQKGEMLHLAQVVAARPSPNLPQAVAPDLPKGLVGRIEIPRLGLSAIIMEGTSDAVLRHAVGHIESTALPGQPGNVGLSAHRDTFFRPLRNIRLNDVINLTTPFGEYRYRVVSTKIVDPHEISVLADSKNDVLTLVTCYPFYFIGAAPNRFIVRAERIT